MRRPRLGARPRDARRRPCANDAGRGRAAARGGMAMTAGVVTGCQRRKRERTASIPTGFALRGALAVDRARHEAGNGPPGWAPSHLLLPIPVAPAAAARREATRAVVPRRASSTASSRQSSRPSWPALACVAIRCPASSSASSARTSNAACWPTASYACTATVAATTVWSPFPARAASAPPAPGGAWPTPPPTSSTGFFPRSPCASGSSHSRFRSATAWPTTPASPVRS